MEANSWDDIYDKVRELVKENEKLKKDKHDLKFEIKQTRDRIDILEQKLSKYDKLFQIQDLTNWHLLDIIKHVEDLIKTLVDKSKEDKE